MKCGFAAQVLGELRNAPIDSRRYTMAFVTKRSDFSRLRRLNGTVEERAHCARIGCVNVLTFEARHPGLYCSTNCRVQASRDLKWLRSEASQLRAQLQDGTLAAKQREEISQALRLVLWQLRMAASTWIQSVELEGAPQSAVDSDLEE